MKILKNSSRYPKLYLFSYYDEKAPRTSHLAPRTSHLAVLAVLSLTAISLTAYAQDTWQGATTAWDTATNWSTGLIPTGADDVILPATYPTSGTSVVLTNDAANSLTFDNLYVLTGGTLTLTSGTIIQNGTTITTSTISSVIAGSNGLTFTSSGVGSNGLGSQIALTAANTFTGAITITNTILNTATGGGIRISADSALGATTNNIFLNNGVLTTLSTMTLNANRSITISGTGELNVASSTTLTYGGTISDGTSAGTLWKNSAGTLILTGSNSYSGGTQFVNGAGTLQVGNGTTNGTLGTGAISTASGGSGTLKIDNTNTYTIADTITGSVTFSQAGSGTTILGGNNSYTGATSVTAGALIVNGNQSGATAAVTVSSGATLGGTGTIGGATTVSGTIFAGTAIGSSAGNTLATSALTLNSTATYKLDLNSTALTADKIAVTGNLTLAGTLSGTDLGSATLAANTQFSIMTYTGSLSGAFNNAADGSTITIGTNTYVLNYGLAGDSGNTGYVSDAITLTVVPEPSTVVLACIFGTGMLLLFRRARRTA